MPTLIKTTGLAIVLTFSSTALSMCRSSEHVTVTSYGNIMCSSSIPGSVTIKPASSQEKNVTVYVPNTYRIEQGTVTKIVTILASIESSKTADQTSTILN